MADDTMGACVYTTTDDRVCVRVRLAKADICPVPMLVHVTSSRDVSDRYNRSSDAE